MKMSSEDPPNNNDGNQDPFLKLTKQLCKNRYQRNNKEVSQSQTNSLQLIDEYLEESYDDNFQTFKTDLLVTEVKDTLQTIEPSFPPPLIFNEVGPKAGFVPQSNPSFPLDRYFRPNPVSYPTNPPYSILPPPVFVEPPPPHPRILNTLPPVLATPFSPIQCTVEELRSSWDWPETMDADKGLSEEDVFSTSGISVNEIEHNENDEKDKNNQEEEACSTPPTPKYNLVDPSPENNQRETDACWELVERVGSFHLGTIFEETEVPEQDIEMLKFNSKRMGLSERGLTVVDKNSPRTNETKRIESNTAKGMIRDVAGNLSEYRGLTKMEESWNENRLEIFDQYRFEDFNPMALLDDPFLEGMKHLYAGNVSNAATCLEAAVNCMPAIRFPDCAAVWLCLGVSQAANEQDVLAIIAFKNYLMYEPNNLHALIFLTFSYLNENYKNLAIITLWDWLSKNEKYSDLVNIKPPEEMYDVSSPINWDFHQNLLTLFLKAADRTLYGNIDVDVKCGLGLLYNMTREFAKASDCFRSALLVDPYDEMLWNYLGESLTNNFRCAESIEAYYNALNLRPNYVRARYNLGVSCSRLGDHKEAMQHYLRALSVQANSSRGLTGRMTDTIWTSVKVAVRFLNRLDLEEAVEKRDLGALNKAFGVD